MSGKSVILSEFFQKDRLAPLPLAGPGERLLLGLLYSLSL
jgi:hypothetical protein